MPPSHTRTIGVAIPIPEPFGGELQRWRKIFGDLHADAIPTHVTLLPPSEVPGDALSEVEEHLREVAADGDAFEMCLRGTGTFRPASPVVFVQVAAGISECERLQAAVRSGPLERPLRFPYHPHVTVAHDVSDSDLDRAFSELAGWSAAFSVWGFSLYEHGPDGVWRPQRDYVFGHAIPGPTPSEDD